MDKNIYLVGFMGTGKTTIAKLLSRRLARTFVELDDLIVEKEGAAIVDIFSGKGEPYFRRIEKEVLKSLSQQRNLVVSCGGGIVVDSENVAILKDTGIVICLEADSGIIYQRVKQYTRRPLLNVADPKKQIEQLLKERKPYYRKAQVFVDTSKLTPPEVTDRITGILKEFGGT